MSLPAVVLAGGMATRLGAITERVPKSLVDVAGRPFAVHQIELLRRHDLTDITFLLGHLGELVVDALGDGSQWGVNLRYVFDGAEPLGTGGAVRRALPALRGPFFVLYGDSYLECDYTAIEAAFLASGKAGLMTVYKNDDRLDRSNVLYADGRVVRYDKVNHTADMQHIDYGLGAFQPRAFSIYDSETPFDLATVYQGLLVKNDLAGFTVADRFYEIGSPTGLNETRAYLATKGTIAR